MKTFRPSSMRCCHPSSWYEDCFKPKALPVPDSTLQLCRSASGFSAPCRGSCYWETQARVTCGTVTLGSQLLTPFASFKGYGYVGFGWFRLAGHLSKWKHETFFAPGTSWNLQTENQAWQSATLSYNPPETQTPRKVENWHCILPWQVRQAN